VRRATACFRQYSLPLGTRIPAIRWAHLNRSRHRSARPRTRSAFQPTRHAARLSQFPLRRKYQYLTEYRVDRVNQLATYTLGAKLNLNRIWHTLSLRAFRRAIERKNFRQQFFRQRPLQSGLDLSELVQRVGNRINWPNDTLLAGLC
jgi:hypothetical protein